MADAQIQSGAIVEQPREVGDHPLLAEIYDRHDDLIGRRAVDRSERTLEVAFGTHPHPDADVGIEAYPENTRNVDGAEVAAADARELPFPDGSFDAVVGRRFLHHVPQHDRSRILEEAARVLAPDGRIVLIEGTPGTYRQVTKGVGFRLGVLGEDTDEYGHLTPGELRGLLDESGFDVVEMRPLGSPLVPLCALRSPVTARLRKLHDRTQWVQWWTLAVGEPRAGGEDTVDASRNGEPT